MSKPRNQLLPHLKRRLTALQKKLNNQTLLVSNPTNLRYLTGQALSIYEREAFLLINDHQAQLLVSPLIRDHFNHLDFLQIHNFSPNYRLSQALESMESKTILIEDRDLRVIELEQLKQKTNFSFQSDLGVIEELREIKDTFEISCIRKACQITAQAWENTQADLKPGVSEKEIADHLVQLQKELGADGCHPAFAPIVAFGDHSAIPHHQSSSTKLQKDDIVLVDFGCVVDGYCSDFTRTVTIASDASNSEFPKIERVIKDIYAQSLSQFHVGAEIAHLDETSQRILLGNNFEPMIHSIGHGVGLDIHERPHLGKNNTQILKQNAVITIEPGLYFPGKFGYRHEDTVLVTQNGYELLTLAKE